jgi:hypothetical protein
MIQISDEIVLSFIYSVSWCTTLCLIIGGWFAYMYLKSYLNKKMLTHVDNIVYKYFLRTMTAFDNVNYNVSTYFNHSVYLKNFVKAICSVTPDLAEIMNNWVTETEKSNRILDKNKAYKKLISMCETFFDNIFDYISKNDVSDSDSDNSSENDFKCKCIRVNEPIRVGDPIPTSTKKENDLPIDYFSNNPVYCVGADTCGRTYGRTYIPTNKNANTNDEQNPLLTTVSTLLQNPEQLMTAAKTVMDMYKLSSPDLDQCQDQNPLMEMMKKTFSNMTPLIDLYKIQNANAIPIGITTPVTKPVTSPLFDLNRNNPIVSTPVPVPITKKDAVLDSYKKSFLYKIVDMQSKIQTDILIRYEKESKKSHDLINKLNDLIAKIYRLERIDETFFDQNDFVFIDENKLSEYRALLGKYMDSIENGNVKNIFDIDVKTVSIKSDNKESDDENGFDKHIEEQLKDI